MRSPILSMESRQITAQSTFDADCRVVKLCARVAQRPWLLRNRMSESFTYGSVGGVGYNLGGNPGGRPAPTRNGTPQGYLSCIVAGRQRLRWTSSAFSRAPLISMPFCKDSGSSKPVPERTTKKKNDKERGCPQCRGNASAARRTFDAEAF